MLLVPFLFVAGGLLLLLLGGEVLLRGAVSLASGLGLSPLLIGMTVVAAATSMPALWLRTPRWWRVGPNGKLASFTSLSPLKADPSQYGMYTTE